MIHSIIFTNKMASSVYIYEYKVIRHYDSHISALSYLRDGRKDWVSTKNEEDETQYSCDNLSVSIYRYPGKDKWIAEYKETLVFNTYENALQYAKEQHLSKPLNEWEHTVDIELRKEWELSEMYIIRYNHWGEAEFSQDPEDTIRSRITIMCVPYTN